MGADIFHAFFQGIDEVLNGFFIFFEITAAGTVGGVGDIAGFHAEGVHHIAFSFFFQGGGPRLKLHREISGSAGKSSGRGAKVDALVDGKICGRVEPFLLQDILKHHLRHAAWLPGLHVNENWHLLFHSLRCGR